MWLFTKYGFYSVVKKKYADQVKPFQIRARKLDDLLNLKLHVNLTEEVIETKHADYHYRLVIDEEELNAIIKFTVDNIDYDNFKNEVGRQENQRDKLVSYHKIWDVMYGYQTNDNF